MWMWLRLYQEEGGTTYEFLSAFVTSPTCLALSWTCVLSGMGRYSERNCCATSSLICSSSWSLIWRWISSLRVSAVVASSVSDAEVAADVPQGFFCLFFGLDRQCGLDPGHVPVLRSLVFVKLAAELGQFILGVLLQWNEWVTESGQVLVFTGVGPIFEMRVEWSLIDRKVCSLQHADFELG